MNKIIIFLVLIFILFFFFYFKPKYTQSAPQTQEATDILLTVNNRIRILCNNLSEHIDEYPKFKPYILVLCKKIDKLRIKETPYNEKHTSYTINKGEISLCLRSKDTGQFHDINLIMYVVLHELSHVICPDKDHTQLFKEIFVFLLERAIDLGIYEKTNYQKTPHEYCGMTIRENILK